MVNEKLGRKCGTKPHIHLLPMAALVLFGLIALVGVAAADNVYHGKPPVTVLSGVLTDNIAVDCVDAWNTNSSSTWARNEQKVWANFTLKDKPSDPNVDMEFARLYVVVYGGNMAANYTGNVSVGLYNNTNYFAQLANYQPLNLPYNKSVGPIFNTSISSPLVSLSRVTSDYLLIFNIKDIIDDMTSKNLNVNISTWNSTGKFDGRVKNVQIIYGYNDTNSNDIIYYWINEGFDTITKYATPSPFYNTTHFNVPSGTFGTKKLWIGIQNNASYDCGAYRFGGQIIPASQIQIMCSGQYGGLIYTDGAVLRNRFKPGNVNLLEYTNGTNAWYKIHTAVLTAEKEN